MRRRLGRSFYGLLARLDGRGQQNGDARASAIACDVATIPRGPGTFRRLP